MNAAALGALNPLDLNPLDLESVLFDLQPIAVDGSH